MIDKVIQDIKRQVNENRKIFSADELKDPNKDVGVVIGTLEAEAILEQSTERVSVDAIVMLQKTLKDEFERVDEVAKDVKGEVDEKFYRGMRSGLKKALDCAERFIERAT